ncbi:MAG TPA: 4-hydroxy-tetrahydrodipicolinate reductase [Candidatus Kapabacteria bacterium]|nr:4-hydroxy-tetrahydrodipicolinate reductase [Candidatus Kapabacteria bacterium]
MRIAIIGHGKMGKEIERLAAGMGVTSFVIFNRQNPLSDDRADLFDVAIDFSLPFAVVSNVEWLAQRGKQVVVGTTGWNEQLNTIKSIVTKYQTGLIHSPNFSIGVYLFSQIVRDAAKKFHLFDEYDIAVHETHHRNKADAPSGTALRIGEVILDEWEKKKSLYTESLHGKIPPDALQITALRVGEAVGEHTVQIDSAADTIELRHTARNRSGFAIGALRAAQWITNKQGVFTMDDMMNDLLGTNTNTKH